MPTFQHPLPLGDSPDYLHINYGDTIGGNIFGDHVSAPCDSFDSKFLKQV
jgi:hypothetical protein